MNENGQETGTSFEIQATDVSGREVSKHCQAGSVAELIKQFQDKGQQVSSAKAGRLRRLFATPASASEEFAIFNAELAAVCERSVPMPEALRALSRGMGGRKLRSAIEEVAADLFDQFIKGK